MGKVDSHVDTRLDTKVKQGSIKTPKDYETYNQRTFFHYFIDICLESNLINPTLISFYFSLKQKSISSTNGNQIAKLTVFAIWNCPT